jgi:Ca-activated chloride channel family protein
MINYESVLMQLNDSGRLNEKLYLVYPKEGIITADYPLMLIDPNRREEYQKLVAYLRSPEFQTAIVERTRRRPVIPQVRFNDAFPQHLLVEVPFPNNLDVINQLLFAYLDEQRIPSHAIFVLDTSGSMEGEGLTQLKTALHNLTGLDGGLTGQFSRFRGRERVTLVIFNERVQDIRDFQINDPQIQGADMQRIRQYVSALRAGGGTAIFSALQQAYDLAARVRLEDAERYYSIVLMSDGENRNGISQRAFQRYYRSLPEDIRRIKTFAVLFGDADADSLTALAETTGGRVFDGRTEMLSQVFKHIRSYQ